MIMHLFFMQGLVVLCDSEASAMQKDWKLGRQVLHVITVVVVGIRATWLVTYE